MLNSGLKRELKARAHSLKPVVIIGQKGITPAVVASISEALDVHELILATELTADVVGSIGRVLILYRLRPE